MNTKSKIIYIVAFLLISIATISAQLRLGESYSTVLNSLNASGIIVSKSQENGLKTLSYSGEGTGGHAKITYKFNRSDVCDLMVLATNSQELIKILITNYDANYETIQPKAGFTKSWKDLYGIIVSYKVEIKNGKKFYYIYHYR